MTARAGLFVTEFSAALSRDIGKTDPDDARLALSSLLQDPTVPGIVYDPIGGNLAVTGRTGGPNMVYRVAAGHPATLRTPGTGLHLWSNDGDVDVDSAAPAPASGSRVDLIYAWGRDGSTGGPDTDSTPQFGVTVGSAAPSNPTKPYASVPDGALVLAESVVAAGNADAAAAVITMVAPFKVGPGAPIPVRSQAERDALTAFLGRSVARLDQGGRVERYTGSEWRLIAPYAEAAGLQSGFSAGSMASGGASNSPQVFPTGRFTVPPRVTATLATGPAGSAFLTARALNVTKDGFDLYIYNTGPSTVSFSGVSVQWHAVQMTATSADG